jgi:NADH-ubiquinone oxidoreductase chain 1
MSLLLLTLIIGSNRFQFIDIGYKQSFFLFVFILPLVFIAWLIIILAETNRAPFDLAEGESELVSGFNIEYGGGLFAILFIAEYGRILFLSIITSILFLGVKLTLCFTLVFRFFFL